MERRLAAILIADMVGYSRQMHMDDSGTLARLKALRTDVFDIAISDHGGRVTKLTGDGMIVIFDSVVGAVQCACAIQSAIAAQSESGNDLPDMAFRIGIDLGEVMLDGEDVYGDGVNIAARLEQIAEPGGIFLSDDAFRQVRGKVDTRFCDLGEKSLKNIPEPVRVHKVETVQPGSCDFSSRRQNRSKTDLPDKPSIAVLPFDNLNHDDPRAYFADGLTEEIATILCKIDKLFVVSPASTRIYKGRTIDTRQVSEEQGVRYVLEGTVRMAGERVRLTAQLTDAETGYQVWGERFDHRLEDIFAVQDEITREVIVALQVELTEGEQARIRAGGTSNFTAWDLTIRGADLVNRHVREDNDRAKPLLEKAVKLDPGYVDAWCQLGWCHWSDARHFWSVSAEASLAKSRQIGRHASTLDQNAAEPWALLAMVAMQEEKFDDANQYAGKAIERACGHSFVIAICGMVYSYAGRPVEAVKLLEYAMRLSPVHPNWYRICIARSRFLAGDLDRVIDDLTGWTEYFEGTSAFPVILIAALVEGGRVSEARELVSRVLKNEPDFTISSWSASHKFKNQEDLARQTNALESLGLPK